MEPMNRLAGRVAIVTGGGRGIGRAVALAYAAEGADVAVVARSHDEIGRTAAEIDALGRRGLAVSADVTDPAAVDRMVRRVLERFGTVNILFNAAGARAIAPSHKLSFDDWQRVLSSNLTASFLCSQRVFEPMCAAGSGKIIMVGSMQAHSGAPERVAYVASKTGLIELTRGLGVEWAHYNINVNVLSPGYFNSDPKTYGPVYAPNLHVKQDLELEYIRKRSVRFDLRLLLRSITAFIVSRGNVKARGKPDPTTEAK